MDSEHLRDWSEGEDVDETNCKNIQEDLKMKILHRVKRTRQKA